MPEQDARQRATTQVVAHSWEGPKLRLELLIYPTGTLSVDLVVGPGGCVEFMCRMLTISGT